MFAVKGYVCGSTPAARPCHRRHLGRRRVAQGYFSATILVLVAFDGLGLIPCYRGAIARRRGNRFALALL
jgi:hypothetical protein